MPGLTGRTAFVNAKLILARMFEYSKDVPATEAADYGYPVSDPNETVKLFVGLVKNVAAEVGVNKTTLSHSTSLAKAMRCMTMLRMGGSGTNTVYIMHYMPTDEDFEKYREGRDQTSRRIAPNTMQRYEDELSAVRIQQKETRVVLEDLRNSMLDEIALLKGRIKVLEDDAHDVRGSETLPEV